jgi:peptidyl-prolyl cis-trans isomerase C
MQQYYNKNKESYKMLSEVKGKEIVVESESLANFLHDSLSKAIGSFDTLAKLYSTAPTKTSGGNMGMVNPGAKPAEVEKVLFKIPLNKLSQVVKFEDKFGIYMVINRRAERFRTFKEVKTQVEQAARAEKTTRLEQKLISDLKADAAIEVKKENFLADTLSAPDDGVVALINGRSILRSDVVKRNSMQPAFTQCDLSKPEEFEKILNTVIEEELKLELTEKKKYYLNEGFFAKYLEAVKRALDQGLYTKIVVEAVTVDSQEVRDYYAEKKEDFKVPESVRGREIVVYSKDLAQDIYDELMVLYGRKSCLIPFFGREAKVADIAQFDSMAKAHSVSVTKDRGGDIGMLRRGGRPKPYEDAAFALKPGAISKPFLVGDSSWTIFTTVEYTPVTYRKYDDVKAAVEANLRREKQRKIVDDFLARIKQEADIKIMLPEPAEEGGKDTEQGPGDVAPVEEKKE